MSVPYADVPVLLAEAARLLRMAASGVDELDWSFDLERWQEAYGAALPALTRPHGAVVTVVEELRPGADPDEYPAVTIPTRVEINGMPLLVTEPGPTVDRVLCGHDAGVPTQVSLTLMARRVLVDVREPEGGDGGEGSPAGVAELEPQKSAAGELAGAESGG